MPHSISLKLKDNENTTTDVKEITKKIAYQLPKTIRHYFPHLVSTLRKIPECRKRTEYELSEIIMGAITMYIFWESIPTGKEGSRNAYNNERKDKDFIRNYKKLFGMDLPHMDTVEDVFRVMNTEEMEKLSRSDPYGKSKNGKGIIREEGIS